MSELFICTTCGNEGKRRTIYKGSGGLEFLLLIIVFPVGVIYLIWRLTTKHYGCPNCGSELMVPVDSPVGKKLVAEQTKTP